MDGNDLCRAADNTGPTGRPMKNVMLVGIHVTWAPAEKCLERSENFRAFRKKSTDDVTFSKFQVGASATPSPSAGTHDMSLINPFCNQRAPDFNVPSLPAYARV